MARKFLVTGADGFVGRALVRRLRDAGHVVVPVVRARLSEGAIAIGDIAEFTAWRDLLREVDTVIHLAARAHVLHESANEGIREYTRVNVCASHRLAQAAAECNVGRFVFLSSVGVNGNSTDRAPFREEDAPAPIDPYAVSKWQAEVRLMELSAQTGLSLCRLRPPLVLGPGAKGNFRRLLGLVESGAPLPFAGLNNQRSFIDVEDLCELLMLCGTDERAAGELFLAAHPEPLSTPDLVRAMAAGLGRRIWMPRIPWALLRGIATIAGYGEALAKMSSSLTVSSERAHRVLGWRCRGDLIESVKLMARAYRLDR